ncbi:MAG TPA: hypothetical protein ACFE0H_04970 [Elainellaceae cyanobacterium]|jgi:cobalamin biosynthesis Mg chelatase CobN
MTKIPSETTPHTSATGQAQSISNSYAPSVPLSVYRELAEELQTIKAQLETVTQRNQTLTQQNQQLHQQIDQVFQSALSLHQLVNEQDKQNQRAKQDEPVLHVSDEITEELKRALLMQPRSASSPSRSNSERTESPTIMLPFSSNDAYGAAGAISTDEKSQRVANSSKSGRKFGGIWLQLTVVVIIITAFCTGFGVIWFLQKQNTNHLSPVSRAIDSINDNS